MLGRRHRVRSVRESSAPVNHEPSSDRAPSACERASDTFALLLPHTRWSAAARRRWRVGYCSFAVYGLILEPTQAFRGLDPRFSEAGDTIDTVLGALFGVTALVLTAAFVILGLHFFRADALPGRPLLRTAVRYGSLAVFVSFGLGIAMSVNSGREIGRDGDLMVAHMLGVHGIQTIPLVALAFGGAITTAPSRARPAVHAAGAGWLGAVVGAMIQALLGRPPTETSLLPVVMVAGLVVWTAAAAVALDWHAERRRGGGDTWSQ